MLVLLTIVSIRCSSTPAGAQQPNATVATLTKTQLMDSSNAPDSIDLMPEESFWELIHESLSASEGNYDVQQELLKKALLKLPAPSVFAFYARFEQLRQRAYTWELWAAAYIIDGGCSDDCFSDFRGWLIGQGRSVFEAALENVESLAELEDSNDGDWEGLSYVAIEVIEAKASDRRYINPFPSRDVTGRDWEEEELPERYPRLWARFGY